MNKLIILTTILLVSMLSFNNATMFTYYCSLSAPPSINDVNDNGLYNMNVKRVEPGYPSNSIDIILSKGNSFTFWDNYKVYYGGETLYINYKYIYGIISQAYLEDCRSNSTYVSSQSSLTFPASKVIFGTTTYTNKVKLDKYEIVLKKSQLVPISNNPLLVAFDTNKPTSKYPDKSNEAFCDFQYDIIITNFEENSQFKSVEFTNGPLFFTFRSTNVKNITFISSYNIRIPSGYSNSTQLIINSSLNNVTYSLTFTCKEIDITKVKLNLVNNRVVNFVSNYISTLLLEYEGDSNFNSQLVVDKLYIATLSTSKSNIISVQWNYDYYIQNGFNILDDLILPIDFGQNRLLNVSTKSYYTQFNQSDLPTLPYEINYYPSYLNHTGSVFNCFAQYSNPIVEFKVLSNIIKPVQVVKCGSSLIAKPIKGSKGNLTFIQTFLPFFNSATFDCTIYLQDYLSLKNFPIQISLNDYKLPKLEIVNFTINTFSEYSDSLFLFTSNFSDINYKYTILSYSLYYQVTQTSIVKSWPFGFVYGTSMDYVNSISFLGNKNSSFAISLTVKSEGGFDGFTKTVSVPNGTIYEYDYPKLVSYEYKRITSISYLFIVRITSGNGIKAIRFDSVKYSGLERLVCGNLYDGIYEFVFNFYAEIKLVAIDNFNIQGEFYEGYPLSLNPYFTLKRPSSSLYKFDLEAIDNLSFLNNNLNMMDGKDVHNIVTLNSSFIPKNSSLTFIMTDPISLYNGQVNPEDNFYPFKYDPIENVFKSSFIIPKNTDFGDLSFLIQFNYNLQISNSAFSSSLIINDSYVDKQGPLITLIEKVNDNLQIQNQGILGWKITITDQESGFKNGIIKVLGSIDNSIYLFNITFDNAISGGNKWTSQYDILINVSTPCISQTFSINSVDLYDNNGIVSSFSRSKQYTDPVISPFFKLYDIGDSFLNVSYICQSSIMDSTPPILLTFSSSKTTIDVGSLDRIIDFSFSITPSKSGMKRDQLPIIYITSERSNIIECQSKLISNPDSQDLLYSCSIELPLGFGYPNDLLFSVYGFVNNGGYFFGFTTLDLINKGTSYSISTTLSMVPFITSNFKYLSNDNELIIVGRCLNGTTTIKIVNSDNGQIIDLIPNEILGSTIVKVIINPTVTPFTIQLFTNQISTNIHRVVPIYFNTTSNNGGVIPTETPIETPTPTPTIPNKPQVCPGNPICGGINNGYCSSNGLCICNSPWLGNSCTSQIIIVPQPEINITDPTTEIPTNPIDGSPSNIFFKSLISLVSLREIDYNGNQVVNHIFDKWIYTPITELKNQYNTSIGTTNITATLEWFNKSTTIEFANNQLIMNPSSIKYTIEITKYQFSNALNQLELIMSAQFESSKTNDICSSEEFGIISSDDGDHHNLEIDNYLKIQIENKSLFGRFIKRGLIDNKVKSISNQLLDESLNNLNESPSSIQAFIAINIGHFESLAIIDPDFSILLDSNGATSSSKNSICSSSSSSKLSTNQLAGIIIGCIAFTSIIVISIIYVIIKNKQKMKFMKNVNQKLQKM